MRTTTVIVYDYFETCPAYPHLRDFEVEIECEISGGYTPATHWDPPEYPEVDIIAVRFMDSDQELELDKLYDKEGIECLEEKALENAGDE